MAFSARNRVLPSFVALAGDQKTSQLLLKFIVFNSISGGGGHSRSWKGLSFEKHILSLPQKQGLKEGAEPFFLRKQSASKRTGSTASMPLGYGTKAIRSCICLLSLMPGLPTVPTRKATGPLLLCIPSPQLVKVLPHSIPNILRLEIPLTAHLRLIQDHSSWNACTLCFLGICIPQCIKWNIFTGYRFLIPIQSDADVSCQHLKCTALSTGKAASPYTPVQSTGAFFALHCLMWAAEGSFPALQTPKF